MMNEPIGSVMTKKVITIHPETTLSEARDIMMSKRIHHLPVLADGHKLVGIITSWDFVKFGLSLDELKNTKAGDVMTRNMATLEADQHLGAVAEIFMEHLFHAVPIVDEVGNLEGIITTTDIIRYEYGKEYPDNLDKFVPENM